MAEENQENSILYVDLYDNNLTEKKGDCSGKVAITGSLRNADFARRIVNKRSEYRFETIVNILDMSDNEKVQALAEGKGYVDGVGQFLPNVVGAFEGEKSPFNPDIHKLNVAFSMGKALRKALAAVKIVTRTASGGIVINDVYDPVTKETNGLITSASNLIINGINIKVAGDNPANGVFLTKTGGTPKPVRLITHNNPSQLTVLLDALEEGEYSLSVTTQFAAGSKTLKEPRTYTLPALLTVKAGGSDSESPDEI
ncbi:DUF4469 domain-containing protein [Parabacteroides sp.]